MRRLSLRLILRFAKGPLALASLYLAAGVLSAQQSTNRTVNARAELARKEITLGDQIYLSVNVSAPPGAKVTGLAEGSLTGVPGLELIEAEPLRTLAERPEQLLEQRFLITSFDTGYVTVPPLAVVFATGGRPDTAYTDDLLLTVKGMPVAEGEEITPIKPIIEEPRNWRDFWWLYVLLIALVGGYAFYLYRKRTAPAAAPPPPPVPTHQRALTALDELEREQLWQNGRVDEYYVRLTDILRTYLSERFGLRAREMTTRQTVRELERRNELDGGQRTELAELLQLSDLVKFARATPAEELHPRGLQRVRNFVEATAPRPQTTPAE